MWLVLAEEGDDSAVWAAQQLWLCGLAPLRTITGTELAGSARWAYRPDRGGTRSRLRLADGTQVDGADVRGVVNRLTGWYARPGRVAAEDLDYALCEYAALLLPFLTSLRCPVVNRPEPVGAAAGSWSPLRWRWQAHQAGLPLAPVRAELADRKQPVVFFDQRTSSISRLSLDVTDDGLTGELVTDGQRLQLADVTAVYLRLQDDRQFPDVRRAGPESAYAQHVRGLHAGLVEWTEITPGVVVNRFSRQASNGSKPYQAQLIHACGFATPPTLITAASTWLTGSSCRSRDSTSGWARTAGPTASR